MPQKPQTPAPPGYASVSITHHAIHRERGDALRRRPGPPARKPECTILGHAWVEDSGRADGQICLVCDVVRW